MNTASPSPTPTAPKRLTATQRLTRQESYSRQQAIVSNFVNFFADTGPVPPPVQTLPVARLISMLDCEHCPGSHYVVVSKRAASSGRCVTTVLDVPLRRLYRAAHDTGLASFWKGVARRRAGAVEYLQAGASFRTP